MQTEPQQNFFAKFLHARWLRKSAPWVDLPFPTHRCNFPLIVIRTEPQHLDRNAVAVQSALPKGGEATGRERNLSLR